MLRCRSLVEEGWSAAMPNDGSEEEQTGWNLEPLTPSFNEKQHGSYVTAIINALKKPEILNIALSGNYGVGKSSILKELSKRVELKDGWDSVVEISLSTLSETLATETPIEGQETMSKTNNNIQLEIVKQLLYREDSNKFSGSRFSRIAKFSWPREILGATLVGFLAVIVSMIFGWGHAICVSLSLPLGLGSLIWVYAGLFVWISLMFLIARKLLYGRFHIKQFSAGPALIVLGEGYASYFDQYLDEIVYYFQISKQHVVFFEDLDRFNDTHIFEAIRSLNTILNTAPQIKQKPIRFIYAMRDGIFDPIELVKKGRKLDAVLEGIEDPAKIESVTANRTKFFDLVIPVVPFITYHSASKHIKDIFSDIVIKGDFIKLVGAYVTDMRLLKNIRNEFVVFQDKIFSGDGENLELDKTNLLAMMFYKNTHLRDFEALKHGESLIDKLYNVSRNLVNVNMQNIQSRLAAFEAEAKSYSDTYHLDMAVSYPEIDFETEVKPYADIDLETKAKFYPDIALEDRISHDEGVRNLKFLRTADMSSLINRPDFLVDYEGTPQSLELVAKKLLKVGLAFELVRDGYIDQNYMLYTSMFYGYGLSATATSFIVRNVQRNLMDEYFYLEEKDVQDIISEIGWRRLSEHALFNIAILDYLLSKSIEDHGFPVQSAATLMVESLARLDGHAMQFIQAYLSSGKEAPSLIKMLASKVRNVLIYLIREANLSEAKRLEFVDQALESLMPEMGYHVDEDVTEFLKTHYSELTTLTSPSKVIQMNSIVTVFSDAGILVADLGLLSVSVQEAFIADDLYEVNLVNLKHIAGKNGSIALDALKANQEEVYQRMLTELPDYLTAIEGEAATNDTAAGFAEVLTDVCKRDIESNSKLELVHKFIRGASPDSEILDLVDVPSDTWALLASENRFQVNFKNVKSYIENIGSIDAYLASMLQSVDSITLEGTESADTEEDRIALAQTILASQEVLEPMLRVELVESLELKDYLPVESIEVEDGLLFPNLLEMNLVADDESLFAHLISTNWETRESILKVSKNAKDLITPAFVGGDLASLLRSYSVSHQVKMAIVTRANEFVVTADSKSILEFAKFAVKFSVPIDPTAIQTMSEKGLTSKDVIALLAPNLRTILKEPLFQILGKLDGDFPKLRYVGPDKPNIHETAGVAELLQHLKNLGIVSSFPLKNGIFRVNKKRK